MTPLAPAPEAALMHIVGGMAGQAGLWQTKRGRTYHPMAVVTADAAMSACQWKGRLGVVVEDEERPPFRAMALLASAAQTALVNSISMTGRTVERRTLVGR